VYPQLPDALVVVVPELELELLEEHAVISSSGTPRSTTSAFLLKCMFPLLARGGALVKGAGFRQPRERTRKTGGARLEPCRIVPEN
jgi:hypothetical protein